MRAVLLIPTVLGRAILSLIRELGDLTILGMETLRCLFTRRLRWFLLIQQFYFVGVRSLMVVLVTGLFTGAVFTAQTQFHFHRLQMDSATGIVATLAMCRELGPVLTALMIAGRVGSSMAAELATMKTTEQIDALRALAVYPIEYLIVPRFVALTVSMPLLTGMAIGCGTLAGYLVAVPLMGVDGTYYWEHIAENVSPTDISVGLIKAFFFGIIIATVACEKGLMAKSGAESVGRATTDAAVNASIAVLISNFFFTLMLNSLLG